MLESGTLLGPNKGALVIGRLNVLQVKTELGCFYFLAVQYVIANMVKQTSIGKNVESLRTERNSDRVIVSGRCLFNIWKIPDPFPE